MQVAEHKLPKAFDYHRTPAPFLQVCLLLRCRQAPPAIANKRYASCTAWLPCQSRRFRHGIDCIWRHCDANQVERTCNLQIKLLRVLGHLGTSDKQASDNMYSVVAESMRRGNTGHTIGNAIVYEAVRTIASIYPNPSLLQSGGECQPLYRARHIMRDTAMHKAIMLSRLPMAVSGPRGSSSFSAISLACMQCSWLDVQLPR